jgi:hypothetical protein
LDELERFLEHLPGCSADQALHVVERGF